MYFLFVKSEKLLVSPHIISITRIYYETYTVKVSFLARDRERDREREFFLV